MGAFACVDPNDGKMKSAESTEVFTVDLSSNSTLNEQRRDVESQQSKGEQLHSVWWKIGVDLPLLLMGIMLFTMFELKMIPSHRAGFFCNDPTLAYPFTGDTVTVGMLMTAVIALPFVIIFITEYIFLKYDYKSKTKLFQTAHQTLTLYRSYLYALCLNLGIVEVMKVITGSPRPTFFAICNPDTGRNCTGSEWVSSYECTASPQFSTWMQSDAAHSFPSGHTSQSVLMACYVAWYLQRRAFGWRRRSVLAVPALQLALGALAAACSLSRVTDHRHHWWDVAVGALVAVLTALYAILSLTRNFAYIRELEPDSVHLERNVTLLCHDTRQQVHSDSNY